MKDFRHTLSLLLVVRCPRLLYSLSRPRPLEYLLSYGVCCSLYTVLEACAQLKITTHRLRLVPGCPQNEFSYVPAERLPYSHGVTPGLLSRTTSQRAISAQ